MIASTISQKEFQVALLMDDVARAKKISGALREIGIFAHYYSELDDFWVNANTESPDLCIVDVKKMSEGGLKLGQHPKVRAGKLKFAFYYTEDTKVLLNSTFGQSHYGLIRGDINLIDQFKNILRRLNEELRLKEQNKALESRIESLRIRRQEWTEEQESLNSIAKYNTKFNHLVASFTQTHSVDAFQKRFIQFFSNWDECSEFGVYILNSTNQKLVSLQSNMSGFKTLPDLWLSIPCTQGIADFAQEMAFEVAYGHMGSEIVPIKVAGIHHAPDYLIVASLKSKNIGLDNLESKLTSEYRRICALGNTKKAVDDKELSIFESFQIMDDEQYNSQKSAHRVAVVDMRSLTDLIKQNATNRFSWKSFHLEFTAELFELLKGECKVSSYGVEKMLVFLDRKYIETNYQVLKHFVADFQYWRYFEDGSLVVADECFPTVKFVAPTSMSILKDEESLPPSVPSPMKKAISKSLGSINL